MEIPTAQLQRIACIIQSHSLNINLNVADVNKNRHITFSQHKNSTATLINRLISTTEDSRFTVAQVASSSTFFCLQHLFIVWCLPSVKWLCSLGRFYNSISSGLLRSHKYWSYLYLFSINIKSQGLHRQHIALTHSALQQLPPISSCPHLQVQPLKTQQDDYHKKCILFIFFIFLAFYQLNSIIHYAPATNVYSMDAEMHIYT